MKYFIDTEFLEGTQDIRVPFTNIKIGTTKPTIDLISIGIVAEDGREYYAISKDFNLKEAWNRFQWRRKPIYDGIPGAYKEYWIRDNVLKPIWLELYEKECIKLNPTYKYNKQLDDIRISSMFNYKTMKHLINKYGKTNKQIAEEVKEFVYEKSFKDNKGTAIIHDNNWLNGKPEFYGYYCDYDWVVFCWLFGKMINLPKGFPMYCIDLKQTFDFYNNNFKTRKEIEAIPNCLKEMKDYKFHPNYPKQTNEHHALQDARWTKELYEFLNKL